MAKKESLKILHTADWHLGKRLDRFSRLDEQRAVLEEICGIAEREKVDAVLIAGDVFDSANPPLEAEELFYRTVVRLAAGGRRVVVAIAGNHDSPGKIENPDPMARACGVLFCGYPDTMIPPFILEKDGIAVTRSAPGCIELQLPGKNIPLRILLSPYAHIAKYRQCLAPDEPDITLPELLRHHWKDLADTYADSDGVNILMAHLFMAKKGVPLPEEPEDEKSILHIGGAEAVFSEILPAGLQYVALGHLHRKQAIVEDPCPVIYSSSPLAYSMSEADQDKYVIIVTARPGERATYKPIRLENGRRLLRATFDDVETAVQWLADHPDAIVEISLRIDTDNYLTAEARQQLHQAHDRLLNVIPLLKNATKSSSGIQEVDLTQDMETLFQEYHQYYHNKGASKDLLALFIEMLGKDSESLE